MSLPTPENCKLHTGRTAGCGAVPDRARPHRNTPTTRTRLPTFENPSSDGCLSSWSTTRPSASVGATGSTALARTPAPKRRPELRGAHVSLRPDGIAPGRGPAIVGNPACPTPRPSTCCRRLFGLSAENFSARRADAKLIQRHHDGADRVRLLNGNIQSGLRVDHVSRIAARWRPRR